MFSCSFPLCHPFVGLAEVRGEVTSHALTPNGKALHSPNSLRQQCMMSSESQAGSDGCADTQPGSKEDGDHTGRDDPPSPCKPMELQAKGEGNGKSHSLVAGSLGGDGAPGPEAGGKKQEKGREAAPPQSPPGTQPVGANQHGEQVKQADGGGPGACWWKKKKKKPIINLGCCDALLIAASLCHMLINPREIAVRFSQNKKKKKKKKKLP